MVWFGLDRRFEQTEKKIGGFALIEFGMVCLTVFGLVCLIEFGLVWFAYSTDTQTNE